MLSFMRLPFWVTPTCPCANFMRVKIEKIAAVEGGRPPRDMLDHIPGEDTADGFSLPIEYWLEGEIKTLPTVGQCVFVERDIRNGVVCHGTFLTTPVTAVTENGFTTKNSVYQLTKLSEPV